MKTETANILHLNYSQLDKRHCYPFTSQTLPDYIFLKVADDIRVFKKTEKGSSLIIAYDVIGSSSIMVESVVLTLDAASFTE